MRREKRRVKEILRVVALVLALLLQLCLLVAFTRFLRSYALFLYALLQIASAVTVIIIAGNRYDTSGTVPWLVILLVFPVFGQILYLLVGRPDAFERRNRQMRVSLDRSKAYLIPAPKISAALEKQFPARMRLVRYLDRKGFPAYQGSASAYFPLGELQFDAMIRDIESAERFVFLEYFIISEGKLWERISQALMGKAREGVEIRILYDDFGSFITIPRNLMEMLAFPSVKVLRFNRTHPNIARLAYVNSRNHQKIAVIDGWIGYTGGTNVADEYANLYQRHGHWKDTAIRVEGEAVWSMTVAFLQMWESEGGAAASHEAYRPARAAKGDGGFYQPFVAGPLDAPDNTAEGVYRSIVYAAKRYVYITTPYLALENMMTEALCTAALSGVDVRILTPRIWDHWYVHQVTQASYGQLLRAGVRIFEYAPGFMHSKTIVSDDESGVVGTINMDYRSFRTHFENGIWICGAPVVLDVKADILQSLAVCEEITLEAWQRRPWPQKCAQLLLKPFAVLL